MNRSPLGGVLLDLCATARTELFLVAPFVKVDVVERILKVTQRSVAVTLVTRWLPTEIRAGVGDLEVWEPMRSRDGARLLLLPALHAKYYRADRRCLLGSANLTNRALGWIAPSNLELLVEFDSRNPEIVRFEADVRREGCQVDDSIVEEMRQLVDTLPEFSSAASWEFPHTESYVAETAPFSVWLPSLRHPENLFIAYTGRADSLTSATRDAALADLRHLKVPPGLEEPSFRAAVAATLLQSPVVRGLDAFLTEPRRFGAVTQWLASQHGYEEHTAPADSWQALMRWLLYFLPERYELEVPNYSEVFRRKR